ncbi:MAG: hypothetical protein LC627_01225, partial [Verrucomicrobiaceae bacterium]|nr:hypothetical protein [Verrucomicrobiaceae bacterium]
MRTSEYTEFEEALLRGKEQRNWLLIGLMISLALHGALCGYFYRTNYISRDLLTEQRAPVPTFKMKAADLQPLDKPSADQTNPAAKPDPDKTNVQLPDEKKSFDQLLDDVHATTALPDDTRDVLPEKPQVDQSNSTSVINEIEQSTAQTLTKNPNATREQNLLSDSATSGRPQPALTGTELATSTTIKRPNTFTKLPGDSAG